MHFASRMSCQSHCVTKRKRRGELTSCWLRGAACGEGSVLILKPNNLDLRNGGGPVVSKRLGHSWSRPVPYKAKTS